MELRRGSTIDGVVHFLPGRRKSRVSAAKVGLDPTGRFISEHEFVDGRRWPHMGTDSHARGRLLHP